MARWLTKLQAYSFDVQHRPGLKHGNADSLSRRPCADFGCNHCEKREVVEGQLQKRIIKVPSAFQTALMGNELTQSANWNDEDLRVAQMEDETLKRIIGWMEEGRRPKWQEVAPFAKGVLGSVGLPRASSRSTLPKV